MGGKKGKHWVKWDYLCFPVEEGGIDFKSLHDISRALFDKLWWRFRTSSDRIWATFLWDKYCKKLHPYIVWSRDDSYVWKKILEIRDDVEHIIWWQFNNGKLVFGMIIRQSWVLYIS